MVLRGRGAQGRFQDAPRTSASCSFGAFVSSNGVPKEPFLKISKIEHGTKIQVSNQDKHQDPLKIFSGIGFEKIMKK